MERNPEYTYDRQTIKYMGEVLANKDIIFEEMNSKSEMIFDIVIGKLILQLIDNDKILVNEIWHSVSSLVGKKCWNNHSNEIAIMKGFFTYGDDILAHAEEVTNKILMYDNCKSITLVDKSISKRTRIKTQRYCDIHFQCPQKKTKLGKKSFLLLNVYLTTVQ